MQILVIIRIGGLIKHPFKTISLFGPTGVSSSRADEYDVIRILVNNFNTGFFSFFFGALEVLGGSIRRVSWGQVS